MLAQQCWQERRVSNPQPPVLETGALPIELRSFKSCLFDDFRDDAGAHGAATFADCETKPLIHGDRTN
jgi:hypothetical protein